MVRENDRLRREVEKELQQTFDHFIVAKAMMSEPVMHESIMVPVVRGAIEIGRRNIMSVQIPVINLTLEKTVEGEEAGVVPYGFAETSGELDSSIEILKDLMPKLMRLAEIEKACQIMAKDIEKTRRRVNALEYIMIPNMQENVRYITMKLDENDRSTTTRLMKVKDMVLDK